MSFLEKSSNLKSRDERLEFFDIAHAGVADDAACKALGFGRILAMEKDISVSRLASDKIEDSIFIGRGDALQIAAKRRPKAICITDFRIDRSLIAAMRDREIALCIGFNDIISSVGLRRQAMLYMSSRLFDYARKKDVEVAFASMANSKVMLLSYVQLIELAKLIGADDAYARRSLSMVTPGLIE